MNGIEKITERIIADARADAERIIAEAEAEAEEIKSSGRSRAAAVSRSEAERAEKLRAELSARAESASAAERRSASLNARARLIDRAFAEAKNRILSLPEKEYGGFLEKLLAGSAAERAASDAANEAGTDEYDEFDRYELLLNARDRELYGKKLVESVGGRIGEKELVLSDETCDVDGGFMLRWGRIVLNCSVSGLVARSRDLYEREVCDLLYPRGIKG